MLQKNQKKGTKYISIHQSPSNPKFVFFLDKLFWVNIMTYIISPVDQITSSVPAELRYQGSSSDSLHIEIKQLFTGHKLTLNLLNIYIYADIFAYIYKSIYIYAYVWLYQVASPPFLNETNHNPKMLSDFRMHLGFIQPTKIHHATFAFPEPVHFHRFHRKPSNRQTPSESNLPGKKHAGSSKVLFFDTNLVPCFSRIGSPAQLWSLKKTFTYKTSGCLNRSERPLAPTPKKWSKNTYGSFIKA